jgi:predicted small secreted protein
MKNVKMMPVLSVLAVVMAVSLLAGCNTMNGLGRDMQATGQAITGVFDGQ